VWKSVEKAHEEERDGERGCETRVHVARHIKSEAVERCERNRIQDVEGKAQIRGEEGEGLP
jgi:hypothetical protein